MLVVLQQEMNFFQLCRTIMLLITFASFANRSLSLVLSIKFFPIVGAATGGGASAGNELFAGKKIV